MYTVPLIFSDGLIFTADGFRVTYCALAALLWICTSLFSIRYFRDEREHLKSYAFFIVLTFLATEGLFLSADFKTAFVFFEILSLSSFPWVLHERDAESIRAAKTYLAIAVIGGLILLMGLWLLYDASGTLMFSELPAALSGVSGKRKLAAGILILLGFGAKAGMFPLHVWLPKAHPVAPAPASALLSGMLTKVGVFGILMVVLHALYDDRAFGLTLLVLAVITMVTGAVLAVFSENIKRTLACSSMSQIGFILTGLAVTVLARSFGSGHAAELALTGALLHMVNHSLLKLLLFLSAGAVAMNLHVLKLDDIRGFGRKKPLLKLCFAAGVVGIGGVPGFNGYLSKTLLHEGLAHLTAEAGSLAALLKISEILFLFSGGLTFAYMLRLFICVFIEKNADPAVQARYDEKTAYLSPLSAAVLVLCALFLLPMGVPSFALSLGAKMSGLGAVHLAAFGWESLKGALISLGTGCVVYFGFIRPVLLKKRLTVKHAFDLEDDLYRPLLLRWLPAVLSVPARLLGENLLLRRLPIGIPVKAAEIMGDNAVPRVLLKGLVAVGVFCSRVLENSLDALVLLLGHTTFKEEVRYDKRSLLRREKLRTYKRAAALALSDVLDNFSYAMMMACIGITLVFIILAVVLFIRL